MTILFLLIPLIGSLSMFFFRGNAAKNVALAVTLANLALTVYCLFSCNHAATTCEFQANWVPSAGISFHVGMDGIATILVLLTNLLLPIIVLTGFGRSFDNESRFYGLVLLMQMALIGVFTAMDGLLFYIFWELALIPIYFICAIWGGENRIRVTLKFFIYTFLGSLLMLVALIFLWTKTPENHSFELQNLMAVVLSEKEAIWVLGAFFLAFGIKMPVFPLHTWQPDTYTTSPTTGTMLLSGIMLKMGIFGVVRWMLPLAPEGMRAAVPVFITLAVIGIVYAGIIAIKQTDLKRLIAYSSISHVGLIAAGVFAWNQAGLQGSMVQMFNHGINVVGLFFACDLIERRLGTRSLGSISGIAKVAPRFATLFFIIVLGAVAVPLTNGFVGEFLLLQSVWQYNQWLGAVAGLTIIFGAVYMLRAFGLPMFGKTTRETENFADLDVRETIIMASIAAMVIGFGFFPQPLLDLTADATGKLLGLAW
jgi:NADH-quinone oxidoreductase subunit M